MTTPLLPRLEDVLDAIEARRGPEFRRATDAYAKTMQLIMVLSETSLREFPRDIRLLLQDSILNTLAELGQVLKLDTADLDACFAATSHDAEDILTRIQKGGKL